MRVCQLRSAVPGRGCLLRPRWPLFGHASAVWRDGAQTKGFRMARVPILKSPDELPGEARRIAEGIVVSRKSLEGPFSVWMHAPEWAERVAHLGPLVRWEGTLE